MARQALHRTATNETTDIRQIDTSNLNLLVSEFCAEYGCKPYKVPDIVMVFNKILWVNWATSAIVTLIGITVMYRKWIKRKRSVEDWPYCQVLYGCIPLSKFTWVPEKVLSVLLFLKIVPSLVIDVIDILADNIYFTQLVTSYDEVLNENIHIGLSVFVILFTFQITGTIKNIILVFLAKRKLDVVGHSMTEEVESSLSDTNAYMAITFYQAILAFCLQDGPEALTQYLYVDKYLEGFNMVFATASMLRVLMSCRIMFIFSRFIYGYVDQAYHSLRVRCLLYSLIFIKFVIFCAHGLRTIAITFTTTNSKTEINCIRLNEENEMIQTPTRCLDGMDTALLILAGMSLVGVAFGMIVAYKYGDKVFNQSHTSGRTATIFTVREMRLGNLTVTEDSLDGNKNEFASQLHVNPRIWLGGISQTSIMARIENLQRKKSSKTNKSFDISIESNTTNDAETEKSRTNYSGMNESRTETIT